MGSRDRSGVQGRRRPGQRAAGEKNGTRRRVPGRETAAAESSFRRTWYGYGSLTRSEKDGYGIFLHDVIRIHGEVSIIGLPMLLVIWQYPVTRFLDVTAMAMVAWLTMTLVGTLVRGGWIQPLATGTRGWVTLAPALLVVRLGYFNIVFALAAFGGLGFAAVTGPGVLGLWWSFGVAALSMLLFPRVVDEWMTR